jgi:short-subunit dehydrogenase
MKTFRDKRVLITGAATGIGRLMSEAMAARGAEVFVTDVDAARAEDVAMKLRAEGKRASAHALDVTRIDQIQALEREIGRIDALVNNAGVVFGGTFREVPLDRHLMTMRVNIDGLIALTHTFLPHLLRSSDGHIVNIASASGYIGLPYGATYAASKWAVIGFSESLRLELRAQRVTNLAVTTVCPGYIGTGMFAGASAPFIMPLLAPERICAKIVEGVERNAAFVREPGIVKVLELLRGVTPRVLFDNAADILGISASMKAWKGRAGDAPKSSNGSNHVSTGTSQSLT